MYGLSARLRRQVRSRKSAAPPLFGICVCLIVLVWCSVALATPVTVQLRVEGATSTIFEGPVTTDGHAVDGQDGTGSHPCDGTNGGAHPSPGPTVTSSLADAQV